MNLHLIRIGVLSMALSAPLSLGCALSIAGSAADAPPPRGTSNLAALDEVAADMSAFEALDLVARDVGAGILPGEATASARLLFARGADSATPFVEAAEGDVIRLGRVLRLADAARWTARALYRARRGLEAGHLEDDATAAMAAAYLAEQAKEQPAVAWYLVRLETFLEVTGADPVLLHHLRTPETLLTAVAHYLHRGGWAAPRMAAAILSE